MVLEKLGESLRSTLDRITKAVFVDDTLLNELIKDIQRALLQADVNVKLVFELTKRMKDRAAKEEVPGLTKKEVLLKIVYEELVKFVGDKPVKLDFEQRPFVIMLVGLFGSGKTTLCGKLAKYFVKRGKRVALLGLDVYRPAAMDQLLQVGTSVKVPVFINKQQKDPVAIYDQFRDQLGKNDVVIVDTAGRDALSEDLMQEIDRLNHVIRPQQSWLVISADIGQTAQKQAETFHQSAGVNGVVITKMDGTAKGGGALTACAVSGAPVVFIGVGEKVDDLESFNPEGFVGRLLGMGDLNALLEKAKEVISEEDAHDLEKKLLKGEFNLIDLYQQMEAMSKMGSLSKIVEMIPGFGQIKLPKDVLQVQEVKLVKWKHAMNSMTKPELEDPEVIDSSRVDRISKGSGVLAQDIRELLKQYRLGKKMVKMMKGLDNPDQLMKKLGHKMKF